MNRVHAWFSLARGWVFDAAPLAPLVTVYVDERGVTSEVSSEETFMLSYLPVADVVAARAWYPPFLAAMGLGELTAVHTHGACVDLVTERWSVRLVPLPSWVKGHTGEVIVDEPETLTQALEAAGATVRGPNVTDLFGHVWYVFGASPRT